MKPSEIMIGLEMVGIQILNFSCCCKKKYSRIWNFLVLSVFTLFLVGIGYFCVSNLPSYGNGCVLFAVLGFLYLIPLKILYKEKLSQSFAIVCMTSVYTLGVFSVSVQAGKLLGEFYFARNVLLIQSVLFLGTYLPFLKLIIFRYVYTLESIRKKDINMNLYLKFACVLNFFTVFGINAVFAMEKGSVSKVIVIALLLFMIYDSYMILYHMVHQNEQMQELEHSVHHDELTGLRNRLSLYEDLQKAVDGDGIFSLLFMDLDKFKQVNDQYGHLVGDRYLQQFAKLSSDIIKDSGYVYRFGGDEFLALYQGSVTKQIVEEIELCREWDEKYSCPFKQVSIGVLVCEPPHMTVDELLEKVDQLMYLKKRNKVKTLMKNDKMTSGKDKWIT